MVGNFNGKLVDDGEHALQFVGHQAFRNNDSFSLQDDWLATV